MIGAGGTAITAGLHEKGFQNPGRPGDETHENVGLPGNRARAAVVVLD